MKIYMVRHGQTTLNAQEKFYGHLDPPLTEKGQMQALTLAQKLPDSIHRVAASPALRCRQTLEILESHLDFGSVRFYEGLLEYDFGLWEGLHYTEIAQRFPESWQAYMDRPFELHPDQGESFAAFDRRIQQTFRQVIQDIQDNEGAETLLLVGHQGPLRHIIHHYLEPHRAYFDINLDQEEVLVYDAKDLLLDRP